MDKISFKTADGTVEAFLFKTKTDSASPLVILYMDAFGPRASLFEVAERLNAIGLSVVIPNLYYRFGDYAPFDPKTAFVEPGERGRVMGMIQSLKIESVISDTRKLLAALSNEPGLDLSRIGVLGYCMGGKFALAAASYFPELVKAAASIHGGGLVTDQEDSPHKNVSAIKGKVYVGIAVNDRSFTEEQHAVLERAFEESLVASRMEVYEGALHGFAIRDMGTYNEEASEIHYSRITDLFSSTL
ncbi:MAG: dienelactone hydrolase family protein [Bacteroidetes bacterium]|nr:dienelactone hydrolase family protein [Bacteroidota bacterium]